MRLEVCPLLSPSALLESAGTCAANHRTGPGSLSGPLESGSPGENEEENKYRLISQITAILFASATNVHTVKEDTHRLTLKVLAIRESRQAQSVLALTSTEPR